MPKRDRVFRHLWNVSCFTHHHHHYHLTFLFIVLLGEPVQVFSSTVDTATVVWLSIPVETMTPFKLSPHLQLQKTELQHHPNFLLFSQAAGLNGRAS